MASLVCFLNPKGDVVLYRSYRGITASPVDVLAKRFKVNVVDTDPWYQQPVCTIEGESYCWVKRESLYLLAVTNIDCNAMALICTLHRIADIFSAYFTEFSEISLRDNFVVAYELLDEIMDRGITQITEPRILRSYIKHNTSNFDEMIDIISKAVSQNPTKPKPPDGMTGSESWRTEVSHKKNEVFLDVIEKVSLMINKDGVVQKADVSGFLQMKCFLSGVPQLLLGLNNVDGEDAANPSIMFEDTKFHQCVQLNKYDEEKIIQFIPPDGEFELMSYRVRPKLDKPLIMVYCTPHICNDTRIEFSIRATSNLKSKSIANNVVIDIPVPEDVDNPTFRTQQGTVKYIPDQNIMKWTMINFQGQRDIMLSAQFGLPSIGGAARLNFTKRLIKLSFEIPYLTVSGIIVKYLRIAEKAGYKALPWVRYITQSGIYNIKMNAINDERIGGV